MSRRTGSSLNELEAVPNQLEAERAQGAGGPGEKVAPKSFKRNRCLKGQIYHLQTLDKALMTATSPADHH